MKRAIAKTIIEIVVGGVIVFCFLLMFAAISVGHLWWPVPGLVGAVILWASWSILRSDQ